MKLEIKYFFPTSTSGANFFINQLSKSLKIRKILAQVIRRQKNPQTREQIFRILIDFQRAIRVQIPTCSTAQKFQQ